MANLKGVLQLFYIDNGRHPSEAEGLAALVQQTSGLPQWQGPYLDGEEGLIDPWGRRYLYRYPTENGGFALKHPASRKKPTPTSTDVIALY